MHSDPHDHGHEHHDHGPGGPGDDHAHRNLAEVEEPLDSANQSLSDALRASFGILKGIMMVLVVLYMFSNVKCVGPHEQALVLRLGALQKDVREAGLLWALPFPIDEVVPLPAKASNSFVITSHTFHRQDQEVGKPLAFVSRMLHQGLKPGLDGALMTADKGLVHTQWKVTYKIENVRDYVSDIHGASDTQAAEAWITTAVENAGIKVAASMTADEVIRTKVDTVKIEMKRLVNLQLQEWGTGVVVSVIEMMEATPPLQVRTYFEATQRAENTRQQEINQAETDRSKILNDAAGRVYPQLVRLLRDIDNAKEEPQQLAALRDQLDLLLETEVEGAAGKLIQDAGAFYSVQVRRMEGDVEYYRALVDQVERDPGLLVARLWEDTRNLIFRRPGVVKLYRPPGTAEFRLHLGRDPEQRRMEEQRRLQKDAENFDPAKLLLDRPVPGRSGV